ncbi:MAG TPA: hypothetical protein VFA69_09615 [Candidatus Nitrosotalea sp.]|nr:hypothetical protein [Candidatus Nitrosotalea sp.]
MKTSYYVIIAISAITIVGGIALALAWEMDSAKLASRNNATENNYKNTILVNSNQPGTDSNNNQTYHNTSNNIAISYNNTLYDKGAFYVKQGQNFTLILNVTSDPVNVPVTLYTASHSGFTKTNGIDFKLSDTRVNTPAKVMLYMSVSKDATPSTYGEAVRLNDTDLGSVTYLFYVTVQR